MAGFRRGFPTYAAALFLGLALSASALLARNPVQKLVDALASPLAFDRIEAQAALIDWKGDLGKKLQLLWDECEVEQQVGLLEVGEARQEGFLAQQAAVALTHKDERLLLAARCYLRGLPSSELKVDQARLNPLQVKAWTEFREYRLRRHVMASLIEAQLKPGNFVGQFARLRAEGPMALDRKLLELASADPAYAEPVNEVSNEFLSQGRRANQLRNRNWRLMEASGGALGDALRLVSAGAAGVCADTAGVSAGAAGVSAGAAGVSAGAAGVFAGAAAVSSRAAGISSGGAWSASPRSPPAATASCCSPSRTASAISRQ